MHTVCDASRIKDDPLRHKWLQSDKFSQKDLHHSCAHWFYVVYVLCGFTWLNNAFSVVSAGMFQRLDKLRKNAFASVLLFGTSNNSCISGIWVFRGQNLAFTVSAFRTAESVACHHTVMFCYGKTLHLYLKGKEVSVSVENVIKPAELHRVTFPFKSECNSVK